MLREYDYNLAIKQCDGVAAAYDECEAAKQSLQSVKQNVSENWAGKSGTSMLGALERWESDLTSIMTRLRTLESDMRQIAQQYQEIMAAEE